MLLSILYLRTYKPSLDTPKIEILRINAIQLLITNLSR